MAHSRAIEEVFTFQLEKLNYPVDDIRWSLGYCQGDGASFSGKLDIKPLAKRLCPQIDVAVWDGLPGDFELLLQRGNSRYVHENSTYLNYDLQSLEGSDSGEWGGLAQKVALSILLPLLQKEIYETGYALAALGYKMIEMSPSQTQVVRAYQTLNFRVEIILEPQEDWRLDDVFGEDSLEQIIQEIESERTAIACACVKVFQVDEGGHEYSLLYTDFINCVQYDKNGPVFGKGTVRELVSEAVVEARAVFHRRNRVTLKAA